MLVEVFHDLICPWCFIGKRRFERALLARGTARIEVRWRPFLLNPALPPQGLDRSTYLELKFGGLRRARQVHEMIAETAARDGLAIDFEAITRMPSTVEAHRLVRFLDSRGGGASRAIERIFSAYFLERRDIGAPAELREIAADLGVARGEFDRLIASDLYLDQVRQSDAGARRMGIQAVPCFLFAGRYALSGAHEAEAFAPMVDLGLAIDRAPAMAEEPWTAITPPGPPASS